MCKGGTTVALVPTCLPARRLAGRAVPLQCVMPRDGDLVERAAQRRAPASGFGTVLARQPCCYLVFRRYLDVGLSSVPDSASVGYVGLEVGLEVVEG